MIKKNSISIGWLITVFLLSGNLVIAQIGPTAQKERDHRLQEDLNRSNSGGGSLEGALFEGLVVGFLKAQLEAERINAENRARQAAITAQKEAEARYRSNRDALISQSFSEMQQGKASQAIERLDKAIASKPEDGHLWAAKAYVLFFQPASDGTAAQACLQQAQTLCPNESFPYAIQAHIAYAQEDMGLASISASKALGYNAENPMALWVLGRVFTHQNQLNQAIDAYDRLIAAMPDYPGVFLLRGLCHMQFRDDKAAIMDFAQAMVRKPEAFEAYFYRAQIYARQQKWEQALAYFDKALKRSPSHPAIHLGRANVAFQMGNIAAALTDLNQAEALISQEQASRGLTGLAGEALLLRGLILRSQGQLTQAQDYFRKACQVGNKEGCSQATSEGGE